MEKLEKIIDFIRTSEFNSLDFVNRFNGKYTHVIENVTTHSWWVSLFASLILEDLFQNEDKKIMKLKYKTLLSTVFHDYAEIYSKDVSFEVKYNEENGEEMRRLIKQLEMVRMHDVCFENNNFNTNVAKTVYMNSIKNTESLADNLSEKIVKTSDWFALIKHVWFEIKLGNVLMKDVMFRSIQQITSTINSLQYLYEEFCEVNRYTDNTIWFEEIRIQVDKLEREILGTDKQIDC